MKCTIGALLTMMYICTVAGCAYAIISKVLKYFSPTLIISIRMLSGFIICLIMLLIQSIFFKEKNKFIKDYFYPGKWPIIHMLLTGILYQGISHMFVAFAQKWVVSSIVQMLYPLIPVFGALTAHIFLPDEKCTKKIFNSLIFSLVGAILTTIPTFRHPTSNIGTFELFIGYTFIIIAIIIWGVSSVYMKAKLLPYNIITTGTYQLFSATIISIITTLLMNGSKNTIIQIKSAPFIIWLGPIIVGIFASGLLMPAHMYVVQEIGSVASNFGIFGQILVGMIVGIIIMNEWAKYSFLDILISLFGVVFITFGIFVGFSFDFKEIKDDPLLDIQTISQIENEI